MYSNGRDPALVAKEKAAKKKAQEKKKQQPPPTQQTPRFPPLPPGQR
jgi:hypothetical protein